MSKEIPTVYRPVTDAECDDFVNFADSTGDQWRECYQSKDGKVKVWDQKSQESAINIVKLIAQLEVDALVLYDVLHDPDYRLEWDENMVEGYLIEQLDATNDVGYYSAKSPVALVKGRDFVNQRSWRVKESTEYLIFNHSVVHPKKPVDHNFVRANSIRSGYLVRRGPTPTGSTLTYITQADPRGWIPAALINSLTTRFAPKLIHKLEEAAKRYPEWKAKHEPDRYPWRGVGSY